MKKLSILFLLFSCLIVSSFSEAKGPPTKEEMLAEQKRQQEPHLLTYEECAKDIGYEDYGYCIWDLAVQNKSIYDCVYMETASGAYECLKSVMKLVEVTVEDCDKMTDYVSVCKNLVEDSSWR